MTDRDAQLRSVYIWVCEGTWRASVDAALSLAPAGARFTLLHVTSADAPAAAHGAYAGMFGRGHRAVDDPGTRLEKMAATSAGDLLEAAAARLGRSCERLEVQDRPERAVVAASADADLLVVARDGDRTRLGPKSLGKITRFVGSCGLPRSAGLARVGTRRGHHSPAAASPFAAESPIPAGSLNRETRTRRATFCSTSITKSSLGVAGIRTPRPRPRPAGGRGSTARCRCPGGCSHAMPQ